MTFLPAQPYKLVLGEGQSNAPLPRSPRAGFSDLEWAMLVDADVAVADLYYLLGRLTYLLRRVPGDEIYETAAVSLRQNLQAIRNNLTDVEGWIKVARLIR